jgi:hypothetical protein
MMSQRDELIPAAIVCYFPALHAGSGDLGRQQKIHRARAQRGDAAGLDPGAAGCAQQKAGPVADLPG